MDAKNIRNVSVIGAGLMGHGLAQVFAARGCNVVLMDVKREFLDRAVERIRSNLVLLSAEGLERPEEIENNIARIKTSVELEETARAAQFIVEAAIEGLKIKRNIFEKLDTLCPPETILATNTSVISITEIAQNARNRQRIVGTHFWNPPYLVPLVEVIKGKDTSSEVVDDTFDFMKRMGKHPVRVNKDVPGFVGNRLQHALWREAISIVENGIADAATVDDVIKQGFGMRLPVLGPLENADMAGLDLTLAIHDYILKHLDTSGKGSPLLRKKVEQGRLGFKTGLGFQEWTPESIDKSRKRLFDHLVKWIKDHR